MLFLSLYTQIRSMRFGQYRNHSLRKETGTNINSLKSLLLYFPSIERASASASGSITLEAAVVIPLYLMAVISVAMLFEISAVRTEIQAGLTSAGRKAALECHMLPVVSGGRLEAEIIHAVGESRLNQSPITGGSKGISCRKSYVIPGTGQLHLQADYKISIPLFVFGRAEIPCREQLFLKAWTGYEGWGMGSGQDPVVYVTESGLVYHLNARCTYLDLSVRQVSREETAVLRNTDGGKYYACACASASRGSYYITGSGNRYHGSLTCSGIKRTIYAVPLSEAEGKGVCSRCGKQSKS